tara:strand:- start:682 stop:933 length:252 start_codon:yes stop_codon:yes gene_type:complete
MTKTTIEQPVTVTAVRFNKNFELTPRRIEFQGRTVDFIDDGIRLCIKKGSVITRIFDLSDGTSLFRLRQEPSSNHWNLLSISQ